MHEALFRNVEDASFDPARSELAHLRLHVDGHARVAPPVVMVFGDARLDHRRDLAPFQRLPIPPEKELIPAFFPLDS